jgi:cell division protease FtsH
MSEFEAAKDKVMMGAERRSMVMTDEEKKLTAYHESGHAVVALHCVDSDPIHKATIIPRGRALGMVMRLPEGDRISLSKAKLEADLAVAMGGRIAEELIFGRERVTTGASSDIKMSTDIARRMVTEWGMSEKLGPLLYGEPQQEVFLGHSVTQHKNMSDATARTVDEEVRRIVDTAYNHAARLLNEHLDQLHTLAKGLLEYETLSGDEIRALLRGETIVRVERNDGPPPPKPSAGRRTSVPTTGTKDSGLDPEPLGT